MHAILARAQTEGNPLLDGDTATFVWSGKRPPLLIGDFTGWEDGPAQTFTRLGRGVWFCSLRFPADAYLEYTFILDEARLGDPLNTRLTPNGLGKFNHYFYMPAGSPTPLIKHNPSTPRGKVTRHVIHTDRLDLVIGRQRTVHLYQPPTANPVPLLVVWDGSEYLRYAHLPTIVDNLIAQGRIHPVALAMVQNGGNARGVEYACSDTTLGFLTRHILPLAQANLNLTDPQQGGYGVLGASMGGLMALYTGVRLPQLFSLVLSQSGAFGNEEYVPVVESLVRHLPVPPIKIWLDVGVYDFEDIRTSNQAMAALLKERGYTTAYQQYNAGHNYPAWRNEVWQGLEMMYGQDSEAKP